MKQFKGIYAALMTPFSKDGKVNFDAMGKLIDRCIRSGVNGFYVCGSTGEGVLLSVRERNEIYACVGEYAAGRAKLIAHVGSLATRDAVAMAKNVRKCGFDAVSAVPPFYYAYGFEEIAGYYRAIADAAELPVIVYNFPNAGTKFTIRDIEELFVGLMGADPSIPAPDAAAWSQAAGAEPPRGYDGRGGGRDA